jgi:hypothetical protein
MNELTPDDHRILVDAIHDSATVIHKGKTMNKRIKLLAEQAGLEWGPGGYADYSDFDHSLFAELIVSECARAIINDCRLNDVRSASRGCVRTIREHFGVEE